MAAASLIATLDGLEPRDDEKMVQFIRASRELAQVACDGNPLIAIEPLLRSVRKLSPNATCLTPVHVDFVQVCLKAKAYRRALALIDVPILEVRPKETGLVTLDLLRYFYYGGNIYIGLRRYTDALEFFQMCVTAPTTVLSAVMTEAYKKMLLVSLILHGAEPALPKYTSQTCTRLLKGCVGAYSSVAEAFSKHEGEGLDKVIAEHLQTFQDDQNVGLLKQCKTALCRRRIQRLTHTYLTLSLDDIAKSAGLEDARTAEHHVLNMVASGEIWATIDQRDGMVKFLENPEQYDCDSMLGRLDGAIQKIVQLAGKLQEMDDNISISKEYIATKVSQRDRPGGVSASASAVASSGSVGAGLGGAGWGDDDAADDDDDDDDDEPF